MTEFSPREQFLIEQLKLLKGGDAGAHVQGALKIRVMREIAAHQASPRIRFHPRFAFASVLAACVVLATGVAASWAAKNSLPDDMLYPVKVAAEDMRMLLVRDPAAKAVLQAEFAHERIREARAIANANADPALVAATLDRYEKGVKKVQDRVAAIGSSPARKSSESLNAIAKNLSDTAVALLEEAQKQLAETTATSSPEVSQKFVEAAQTSVAVLSEVVERLEEGKVDNAPVLP